MILDISNLSVCINKKQILKSINFSLKEGEILCILGKNGSGKSTLLKAILGFLNFSGALEILGKNVKNLSIKERAKLLSYVPQMQHFSLPFTLQEIVLMGNFAKSYGRFSYTKDDIKKSLYYLESLRILHLKDCIFSTLSGGEQQLGLIARALVQDTPLIVLDEPVSALDISHSYKLLNILKSLKKTIILTSHHIEQCFIATQLLMLKDGEILAYGKKDEILNTDKINALYGVKTQSVELPNGGKFFVVL